MTNWDNLLSSAEIAHAMRERKKTYVEKTTWRSALADEETEGWYFYKDSRSPAKVKVRKDKPADEVFENRLWVLFASMGFYTLNRDRHFCISYSQKGNQLTKQIDVFAADDETVLVCECKCAKHKDNDKDWNTELQAINGYQSAVRSEILKQFPGRNVKFIFATKDYIIGEKDLERMEEFNIAHFDEKVIEYYEELVKHIGSSARYQLLGSLFSGKKVKGLNIQIPAVQGKMGSYTYYAFSIQPETLLKIGYVLHRSEANDAIMPTYQRIIKKARLKSVHEFIENGGFFPNAIVISIDSKSPLQFDLAQSKSTDDIAKLGVLHLPNKYRSAYIIDGQHRVYGYSDSRYAKTNSIPVVAFENMPQAEQVKLFMEINENQKAVSKNLRNTLNSDLLWISDNPEERREAIRSKIAQDLGDKRNSPLYGRVIIGEDTADEYRCITLEAICLAIKNTNMLTKFDKNKTPIAYGVLDFDDNEKTLDLIEKYLFGCFNYLKIIMPDEWNIEQPKKDSMLLFNNAIGGLITLFGDIANELKNKDYDPRQMDQFLEEAQYYLDPIEPYLQKLTDEEKNELRSSYGTAGPRHFWRNMQRAVHEAHNEFYPEGYDKYWEDHSKSYNDASIKIMEKAEATIREYIHKVIIEDCTRKNENWTQQIPKKVYTDATTEASKAEYNTGEKQDVWEYFTMASFQQIVTYGNNWTSLFEQAFTLPSVKGKRATKQAKTEWMTMVDKLQRAAGRSNFTVTKAQYETLLEVEEILPTLEVGGI